VIQYVPNAGVVLDAQVDVLGDTETEVAGLAEVALAELVLLDLEATLEDLLSLGAADGDVDGDLFVTTDTEGTDGVAGLGVDGGLTRQLLENLGGTSEPVTRLSDGDVEDELLDAKLAHGVGGLGVGLPCQLASRSRVVVEGRSHTMVTATVVSRRDGLSKEVGLSTKRR
jgi:hypothetical protein